MISSITGLLNAGSAGLGEALRARLDQRIASIKETVEKKTADRSAAQSSSVEKITGIGETFSGRGSVLAVSNEAFELLQNSKQEKGATQLEAPVPTEDSIAGTDKKEILGAYNIPAEELYDYLAARSEKGGAAVDRTFDRLQRSLRENPIYRIEEHLTIKTPRPNIDDTYFHNSYSARTGLLHRTAAENRDNYWDIWGNPVDRVLDRNYQKTIDSYNTYQQALEESDGSEFSSMFIQAYKDTFTGYLNATHESHAEHGLHDYAEEVFAKRSQQELGISLNLNELYQQYGIG